MQRVQVLPLERRAGRSHEPLCLLAGEHQVAPTELEQPPAHAQGAQRQGRRVARGDQELCPGREVLTEEGDDGNAAGAVDQVQVVHGEGHVPGGVEAVDESGKDHPLDRRRRTAQAREHASIDWGDAVDGGGELEGQEDRVGVGGVEREPGERAIDDGRVLGQEDGLAVAGGGGDDHHRRVGPDQAAQQADALDQPGPGRGRMELGLDDEPRIEELLLATTPEPARPTGLVCGSVVAHLRMGGAARATPRPGPAAVVVRPIVSLSRSQGSGESPGHRHLGVRAPECRPRGWGTEGTERALGLAEDARRRLSTRRPRARRPPRAGRLSPAPLSERLARPRGRLDEGTEAQRIGSGIPRMNMTQSPLRTVAVPSTTSSVSQRTTLANQVAPAQPSEGLTPCGRCARRRPGFQS